MFFAYMHEGFTNKDISLHVDKYGHLVVRGSHQMTEHKYVSFAETFDVPEGADLELAEGMFEDDQIYCIVIPKNDKLGQEVGDGGSTSKGVKLEDHDHSKDNKVDSVFHKHGFGGHVTLPNQPSLPFSVTSKEKSMKRIVFIIMILIALYAAWLNRDDNY